MVDPPGLQRSPGNETHLHAFATTAIGNDGTGETLYLHTSPEFSMKKLLAAGERRIASLGHVWRNRERSALHHPEFTMLEWYRAGEPYDAVIADCVAMLRIAAETAGAAVLRFRGRECDPFAEPERIGVVEAFQRFAGVELIRHAWMRRAGRTLRRWPAEMRRVGLSVPDEYTWSYLFSRMLVEKVEPNLGLGRVTVLDRYPAAEAALARRTVGDRRFGGAVRALCVRRGVGERVRRADRRSRTTREISGRDGRKAAAIP